MKFCLTLATVLLGAISLEASAQAQQPWLADRKYGEGIGVRVGNLELHPGISGELGYDSNYFLRSSEEDPLSAYRIRITPSITLSTLGPQRTQGSTPPSKLTFRGGAYLAYNEIIATDSKYKSEFADQRHLDVGSDIFLNIMPVGRVGGDTYLNFVRQGQPSNNTDTQNAFDRDSFRAGAGVTWRPGGGLFDWRLGYEFLYNYFEKEGFSYLNNFQHQVNMRGRWRFLPRTALLYDGNYTWVLYPNPGSQNDGTIARSRIGMNGLITNQLSLLALIGWAGTFYKQGTNAAPEQFDSLTAQAELKWYISGGAEKTNDGSAPVGLSYASIGYTRDVSNSYLGNFYQKDRGYVGVSYMLGGAFVTSVTAGIANLAFPTSYFAGSDVVQQDAFSEQRVDASVFGEYRLSNTFGLNATFNYDRNFTDVAIKTSATDPDAQRDYLAYQRWQVFLGARWFL